MGICQENICIVDVLKEQLNFVLSAHQRILHKCIHAVEIDFLKFNFRKTIVQFRILESIIHFYPNRMCDNIQLIIQNHEVE